MSAPVEPRRAGAVSDLPRGEASSSLETGHESSEVTPESRETISRFAAEDRSAPRGRLESNGGISVNPLASAGATHPSSPPESGPRDSERVGRFCVLQRLGHGAMGIVYDAYDESLDRRVALKVLRRGLGSHEALAREAKALARLAHPNVVQVYEIGEDGDRLFVAMELVRGRTLRKWLEERPRSCDEVLRVFRQAGEGLAAAHRTGLVHRDFKPDNVLLGDDGRVRVVDFGVAALVDGAGKFRDHGFIGTPAFMAPEQFLGERVTAAVDQFAFSVALYRALFGAPPFEGDAEIHTLRRNVVAGATRPPPPSPDVPAWVSRLLIRGLARDATARFATMDELIAEIDGRLPQNRELDANVGRRERGMLAAAMALFGGIVLGGLWFLRGSMQGPLTMGTLIALPGAAVTGLTLAAFVLRRRLLGNRFARNVAAVVWLSMISVVLHRLLALYLGEAPRDVIAVDLLEIGMQLMMAAILVERSFALAAALFLGGSAVAASRPEWAVAAYMGAVIGSSALGTAWWAREP